nr:hypothetical protein GCM10020063_096400 [Dactylosporangium thailandense]
MGPSLLGQAAGMFAVTNIDDLLVLAVLFIGIGLTILIESGAFGL